MNLSLNTTDRSFNRKLITVLLTAAALWAVWYLHEVILLVFLSIIIAIGISIPAKKFRSNSISSGWATSLSVILVSIIFNGVIVWLLPLLAREIQTFIDQLPQLLQSLQSQFAGTGVGDILDSLLSPTGDALAISNGFSDTNLLARFVDNGLPVVFSGAGALISVVTNLVLVFIVSVMLLVNPKSYLKALLYVVPKSTHQPIVNIANKIYDTIKAWLKSLSFSIAFTSIAVFIGMSIVGVENPAAIALFAAFATFIPNIGAIIPILPIALFTLPVSLNLFIIAVIVYLAIQLVESNFVTPLVVKHQLDIPVAGILVFQIIAGVLFGLLGVLLAVPLLATLIVIVRELVAKHHYHYQVNEIELTSDTDNHLVLKNN